MPTKEALRELAAFAGLNGMIHGFTARPSVAERYLELGYHISVGAEAVVRKIWDLQESVRQIPLSRLLIESDCPDQPPPGQSAHDSSTVWLVAEKVAELKKLSLNEVVEQTRNNFLRLINKGYQAL